MTDQLPGQPLTPTEIVDLFKELKSPEKVAERLGITVAELPKFLNPINNKVIPEFKDIPVKTTVQKGAGLCAVHLLNRMMHMSDEELRDKHMAANIKALMAAAAQANKEFVREADDTNVKVEGDLNVDNRTQTMQRIIDASGDPSSRD